MKPFKCQSQSSQSAYNSRLTYIGTGTKYIINNETLKYASQLKNIRPFRNLRISCFGRKPHSASNGVRAIASSGLWLSSTYVVGFAACNFSATACTVRTAQILLNTSNERLNIQSHKSYRKYMSNITVNNQTVCCDQPKIKPNITNSIHTDIKQNQNMTQTVVYSSPKWPVMCPKNVKRCSVFI